MSAPIPINLHTARTNVRNAEAALDVALSALYLEEDAYQAANGELAPTEWPLESNVIPDAAADPEVVAGAQVYPGEDAPSAPAVSNETSSAGTPMSVTSEGVAEEVDSSLVRFAKGLAHAIWRDDEGADAA